MTIEGRQQMARLMLEGVVILVSVLLAFWIDAAWELHRDRNQAFEFLDTVHDELERNVGILADHVASCEGGTYAAQRTLVALTSPAPPQISPDSVTRLVAPSLAGVPPRLEAPAVDALVSSGALSDIGSAMLRREFGRWRNLLEVREERRTIYENEIVKALDYFVSTGVQARWQHGSRVGLPRSNFSLDVEALLSDPVFSSVIGMLAIRKGQMCIDDARRGEQAGEVLGVVRAELGR